MGANCGIFQCLYEAEPQWDVVDLDTNLPRLRNSTTGEQPIVLHGNGHTGRWFLQKLWRELRFLERCCLTHVQLAYAKQGIKFDPWSETPMQPVGASGS